jgi:TonB family protein
MRGALLRSAFFAAGVLAACMCGPLRAGAQEQPECPASATSLVAVTGSSRMLYAFHLPARAAQTVNGFVAIDTNRGWFSVPLRNVRIEKIPGGFGSATLYARFPAPLRVVNSWLAHVGEKACYPSPLLPSGDREWPYTPQDGAQIIQAAIMQAYGRSDCTEAFAPPRAVTVVLPDFDRRRATFSGTAIIDVTIGLDGKPLGASIVEGSRTPAFDDAAREAALKSTYSPALAYCVPTIAKYIYKATLRP